MRNDIHKPSLVRPEDYHYIGVIYQGFSEEIWDEITDCGRDPEYRAAMEALSGTPFIGNHKLKGTCDHCGAAFSYGMVYKHEPTSQHICVGHVCATETFGEDSRRDLELKRMKSRIAAQRRLLKLREHAAAFMQEHYPDLEVVLGVDATPEHYILKQMQQRIWNQYPELTTKQITFARDLRDEKPKPKKEVVTEPLLTQVVVGKAIEITGKVLCTKWQENQYGGVEKMLVMDNRRFKVWGTVPKSISPDQGDQVTFIAQVEVSDNDDTFGFFKRPRKASCLLETASAES